MKKFFDSIKDMLYDSIDVILVVVIFLVVGGTILWRLDILFTPDLEKTPLEEPVVSVTTDNSASKNDSTENNNKQNDSQEQGNNNSQTSTNTNRNNTNSTTNESARIITVNIPSGSFGNQIAEILISEGLLGLDDKWTFLTRARELGLDTKLKAGTFEVPENASMDLMIRIIARQI